MMLLELGEDALIRLGEVPKDLDGLVDELLRVDLAGLVGHPGVFPVSVHDDPRLHLKDALDVLLAQPPPPPFLAACAVGFLRRCRCDVSSVLDLLGGAFRHLGRRN
jgi:hypothetical protein